MARKSGVALGQLRALRQRYRLSATDLEALPVERIRRAATRMVPRDSPGGALAFRRSIQAAKPQTRRPALKLLEDDRKRIAHPQGLLPAPTEPLPTFPTPQEGWRSLGPDEIGGRARALAFAGRVLFAGSAAGGIWRLENETTWSETSTSLAALSVSTFAVNPRNPQEVFAGTGEQGPQDGLAGAGVYVRSGEHWDALDATGTDELTYVRRLAVSADGNTLLIANDYGIWQMRRPFTALEPSRLFDGQKKPMLTDVEAHPRDPKLCVAGGADGHAYYSTNGGLDWAPAKLVVPPPPPPPPPPEQPPFRGYGAVELRYASADPSVVYASVDYDGGLLYRSNDGGRSYVLINENDHCLGDSGWYTNTLWAGGSDPNLVLVGGVDLWRSADGGRHLERISDWSDPSSAHADQHYIVSSPSDRHQLYVATDGGIYRTDDVRTVPAIAGPDAVPPTTRPTGWTAIKDKLRVTQFYGAAIQRRAGGHFSIAAGTQDNGTLQYDSSTRRWTVVGDGDGGHCLPDPRDDARFLCENQYLGLYWTAGNGTQRAYVDGEIQDDEGWLAVDEKGKVKWRSPPHRIPDAGDGRTAPFVAPLAAVPGQPEHVFAGGRSLWVSKDVYTKSTETTGPEWSELRAPRLWPDRTPMFVSAITTVAGAEGKPPTLYVGYDDGAVFRLRLDLARAVAGVVAGRGPIGEADWERLGGATLPKDRMCTSVVVDRRSAAAKDRIFVTYGGQSPFNIWRSDDGGATWHGAYGKKGAAPIAAPVYHVAVHPLRSNVVFAATEYGVYESGDAGDRWVGQPSGPAGFAVNRLLWLNDTLFAMTHGRGAFARTIP